MTTQRVNKILSQLPNELVYEIDKMVHKLRMKDIHKDINVYSDYFNKYHYPVFEYVKYGKYPTYRSNRTSVMNYRFAKVKRVLRKNGYPYFLTCQMPASSIFTRVLEDFDDYFCNFDTLPDDENEYSDSADDY